MSKEKIMEYFDKETSSGYSTPEAMKRVWDVQLDLLRRFSEACERNGLRFWLEGGTMLGAVRHKGFIPWDDDIDVAMMRDDYDKLNRIAGKEFEPPYFWQTTYSDTGFYCGHAILRRTDTTCLDMKTIDSPYCLGIGIDIFVMDGVPSNGLSYAIHRLSAKMLISLIRFNIGQSLPYKRLFSMYESLFRLNDARTAKRIGLVSWRYRHKEIHPRSYYGKTVMLDFAGESYPVPSHYTDWLSDYYGPDYLTPKMAPNFHGAKYIDSETAYTDSRKLLKEHPELFQKRIEKLYRY